MPEEVKIGEMLLFNTGLIDISRVESLNDEFYIKVGAEDKTNGGKGGSRRKPAEPKGGKDRKITYVTDAILKALP